MALIFAAQIACRATVRLSIMFVYQKQALAAMFPLRDMFKTLAVGNPQVPQKEDGRY